MYKILFIFFLLLFSQLSYSAIEREGKYYGYFGWNNSTYKTSDIHFKGNGYNFKIHDVKAQDHQVPVTFEKVSSRYLNPANLTIPQYNYRFGYFFTNNFAVSLGWDHMKYVMNQDQTVKITGVIENSVSTDHSFSGTQNKKLTSDFLSYEHTDGFNTITIEGEYYYSILSPSKGFDISILTGFGAGVVIPKSNVQLLGKKRNDEWHLAGVAATVKVGVELTAWENFFFRAMIKQGYANMYDVLTTSTGGKATQEIVYSEYYGVFGYRF